MSTRTDRMDIDRPAADEAGVAGGQDAATTVAHDRAAYAPPRLERLGAWNALTLQQSVPIFPLNPF